MVYFITTRCFYDKMLVLWGKCHKSVIDTSYQFSWLAIFPTKEAQDAYQVDPIHLHFVDTCKHLWKKVSVLDSVGAY